MDNAHDLQYFAKLNLGTQELNVVLDTGSIEFVVLSDKCSYWCGPEKRLFHSNQSATYTAGKLSLILSYGSGELLGSEAYDKVSFGPFSSSATAFWEVTDASMPLLFQAEWAAIVGLGPMSPTTKVMELRSSTNKNSFAILPRKFGIERFGICLGKEPGSQGYITWNDASPELFPEDFTKINMVDTGYWMMRMTDVWLGNTYLACEHGCGAVADSGTSLLSLPPKSYNDLKKRIDELKADCNNLASLPDLHFKLDGVPFSLPPDSYIGNVYGSSMKAMQDKTFNPVQGRAALAETRPVGEHPKDARKPECQAALMHITMESSAGPVWILGMPFFRKYYSVFAQRKEGEKPTFYAAVAGNDCHSESSGRQGLLGPSSRLTEREEDAFRSGHTAREVDMSQVRVPAWVRRAAKLGRLEEVHHPPVRRIGTQDEVGLMWSEATAEMMT